MATSLRNSDNVRPIERLVIDLHGFERQLVALFAIGGRLATSLADAHTSQPIAASAGHQAYAGISTANAQIGQAMASVAVAHRALDQLARKLGIDISAYGDPHPKPDAAGFFTRAQADVESVG